MGAKCCSSISNSKKFANIKLHLMELMEKAFQAEEYDSALVTADEILKKDPKNHYVIYYKALIYKQTKKFEIAEKVCLKFLKYNYNFRIEFLLVKIYLLQSKYEKAIKFLNEKVLIRTDNVENYFRACLKKARILYANKEYCEAFIILESFLDNFKFFKERNKEFKDEEEKLKFIYFNPFEGNIINIFK